MLVFLEIGYPMEKSAKIICPLKLRDNAQPISKTKSAVIPTFIQFGLEFRKTQANCNQIDLDSMRLRTLSSF